MKQGRLGRAWTNARRKIKKSNFENQITRCERCGSDFGLGNAHRFKRRKITTQTELMTTVLLCVRCHSEIEILKPEMMKQVVDEIIAGRDERYWQGA